MFEGLGEIIVHSTISAITNIYKFIRYIFSKNYRIKLKKEWKKRHLDKISLTFVFILFACITSFALWFWGNVVYIEYFKEKTKKENIISQKVQNMIKNNRVKDFFEFVKHHKEK